MSTISSTISSIVNNRRRRILAIFFGLIIGLASSSQTDASLMASGPSNDNFSDAQLITNTSNVINGANVGATIEPGEPSPGSASVWYRLHASSTGNVIINYNPSIGDSFVVDVYTGSRVDNLAYQSLVKLKHCDFNNFCTDVATPFRAVAGTDYFIRVATSGTPGTFQLSFSTGVTISGKVKNVNSRGLAGANVKLSMDFDASIITDGSGLYSFTVPTGNFFYSIIPVLPPANFSAQRSDNLTHDMTNVDFKVLTPNASISGTLTNLTQVNGISVIVGGTGISNRACGITNQNNAVLYACTNLSIFGDYVVTPASGNYIFTPLSRSFPEIAGDLLGVNFAAQPSYSISGQVTGGGIGLSGLTVTLSGSTSATTTTNANGNYSFAGLAAGGNYTITPTNTAQYAFTSQTVNGLQSNQTVNFTGTLRSYTISGQVIASGAGLSGATVTLTGPAGFTTRTFNTAADGNYFFAGVPAGSNYTVAAAKTNYTFSPSSIAVTNLLADRAGANFTGTLQTFSISGRASVGSNGLSGVTMTLSGGQTGTMQTDANGNYSFTGLAAGGNYTITPTKANYSFAPPNRTFTNLSANQTGDFAGTLATYTIGGQVTAGGNALSGVTLTLSGSQTGSTTTDAAGNYSFPNLPAGGNYTIIPSKANYSFSPASRSFNNLVNNQTGDFIGTLGAYTIGGRISVGTSGLSGVTITLSGTTTGTMQTDANGNYSFSVAAGGTYTVTPTKPYYSFNVPSQTFSNLSGNQIANFTATLLTYTLSGRVTQGNTGLSGVTITLSGDLSSTMTTNANGDYSFATVPGGSSLIVTPSLANNTFMPANQSINVDGDRANINFTASLIPATVQFSIGQVSVNEGAGSLQLTVTRTGDTSNAVSVDYRTADTDTFIFGCADTVNNQGGAYARCDFATAFGKLQFAAGESSKTITISIIDDAIVEGNETFQVILSNPTSGATLGAIATATITIVDNDTAGEPNPIFSSPFFVRQQYLDFFSREPDIDGYNGWLGVLNRCSDVNSDPTCDRILVSLDFFRSEEFQIKGYYVYRFYKLAFNRLPRYSEIIPDLSSVNGQTPNETYERKATFADSFAQRTEFTNAYGAMSNSDYVAALMNRYQLTSITTTDPANPDGEQKVTLTSSDLINRLNAQSLTRAKILRAVADSDQVFQLEYNRAFVAIQYFGYLRRDPETSGYEANVNALNANPNDFRNIINGFVNSPEYQLRFGRRER